MFESIGDWLIDMARKLFFLLDSVVFPFIGDVYDLLIQIANTTIFTEEIIDLFASKVYALLGIFMLFKVSFSIMTYIVNPDEFTDKTKGFSKLISNIVVTLALLLFTPWIFSQAMDIQRIILKDNIIGKVFSIQGTSNVPVTESGKMMAYETFKAFYRMDENFIYYENCKLLEEGEDAPGCDEKKFGISKEKYNKYSSILRISYKQQDVDFIFDFDLLNQRGPDGKYIMHYSLLVSTIVGAFVVLILINFCFDIAIRSIKLGFLRMIAPVPIVSRIDPKKGKETFDKWVKECVKTYLDLFIRLLAIYFAIFVIAQVASMKFVDQTTGLPTDPKDISFLAKVFIIMGALLFAKQLPKLISDLTGAKLDGKFTLNPFKRAAEVPILGKSANLLAGGIDSKVHGNGFFKGIRRNWDGMDKFIGGGDGKTSILETADRKMRREVHTKRDSAKARYEAIEAEKKLDKLLDSGEKYKLKIAKAGDRAEEIAKDEAEKRGLTGADRDKFIEDARKDAELKAERHLYGNEYYDSKKKVDDAKTKMYAWDNYVTRTQEEYSWALNHGTEEQKQDAFKKYEEAKKNAGLAKGQYERMQKEHEHYKATHEDGAKIEDTVDAFDKMGGKKIGMPPTYEEKNPNGQTQENSTNGSGTNPTSDRAPLPPSMTTTESGIIIPKSSETETKNDDSGHEATEQTTKENDEKQQKEREKAVQEQAERIRKQEELARLRKEYEEKQKEHDRANRTWLTSDTFDLKHEEKRKEERRLRDELEEIRSEKERLEANLGPLANADVGEVQFEFDDYGHVDSGVRYHGVEFDISKYEKYKNTDKVVRLKIDSTKEEIEHAAEKLIRLKENGINAEILYNGVVISNRDYDTISEIRNFYIREKNK